MIIDFIIEDLMLNSYLQKNFHTLEQYKNKLGADPYDSIIEMYSYQQSYQAALKVGSYMIGTSLFDFMR